MALSRGKRILCSLWLALLALPALVGVLVLYALFDMGGSCEGVDIILCFVNILVPLSLLLASLVSSAREDRLVFLISLFIWSACLTMSIMANILAAPDEVFFVLCLIGCAYAFGALALAIRRLRGYLIRVELYRSPEHRDALRSQSDQRRADRAFAREQRRERRRLRDEELKEAERRKIRGMEAGSSARRGLGARESFGGGATLDDVLGVAAGGSVPSEADGLVALGAVAPTTDAGEVAEGLVKEPAHREAAAPQKPASVDVNTCQATDLLALPGMSAATARGIVSERDAHGPYESVQQLVARNGLKPHVVAPFIGYLSTSAPTRPTDTTYRARVLDL